MPAQWLVVLPAATGLAGALGVAIYQGRSSDRNWKNDARLRAYAVFIESTFEFDRAIAALGPSPFCRRCLERRREAADRVGLALA